MKPKQYPVHQDTRWLEPKFKPANHILAIKALPFFLGLGASRVHRPHNVVLHYRSDWEYSHASVTFYCGNSGHASMHRGALLSEPPDPLGVCERCEMAATAAGLPTSTEIAGKPIRVIKTKRRDNRVNAAAHLDAEQKARQISRNLLGRKPKS